MRIRNATPHDLNGIREVILAAFPESERELVANLAVDLLSEKSEPPTLSLVAEKDGEIVGHVALSPVVEQSAGALLGYILAPLAVQPDCQKEGVGSELVEHGVAMLSEKGSGVLLVYGDPEYYGRFGFQAEVAEPFLPPYPLEFPFGWQGLSLGQGELRKEPVRIECVLSLSKPELW